MELKQHEIISGMIQPEEGGSISRCMLYVSEQTKDGHYLVMQISSAKQLDPEKRKQFSYVPVKARETGLYKDSFICTNVLYRITEQNILKQLPTIQLTAQHIQNIQHAQPEQPQIIDCSELKSRTSVDELSAMVQSVITGFQENEQDLAEFLAFSVRFYEYSADNQLRIYRQNRHATFVGSFKHWKELGYSVKKGQTGIKILCPRVSEYFVRDHKLIPISKATTAEKQQIAKKQLEVKQQTRFFPGTIFDISQTNCPKTDYPKRYDKGYQSLSHALLYDCMAACVEQAGISIESQDLQSISLNGYCVPQENKIMLSDKLEDSARLAVLCHEYAHTLIHHNNPKTSKEQIELEAGAFAVMMCHHLGVPVELSEQRYVAKYYHKAAELEGFDFSASMKRLHNAFHFVDKQIQEELPKHPQLLEQYQNRNRVQGEVFEPQEAQPVLGVQPALGESNQSSPASVWQTLKAGDS